MVVLACKDDKVAALQARYVMAGAHVLLVEFGLLAGTNHLIGYHIP